MFEIYTSLKKVMGFRFNKTGIVRLVITASFLAIIFSLPGFTEEGPAAEKFAPPVLKQAVLCEKIEKSKPVHEGVVFSAGIERLFCFTYFDPVYGVSEIFHKYYFNDKLEKKYPLSIKPPSYKTYSRIDLRESDKGPWRVEITDAEDNVLTIIRFSITD
ncbi:MAG: DUF2914 domain-containing protein [Desulfatiglans sp.]|jgi:hypothetical protein|nr:DUF2914 domain-containing protein [Desulfatiglans sp.]